VKYNRPDVLGKLLDMGLDPNERMRVDFNNYKDWTQGGPLYHAVVDDRLEMARMLLARGANPNASVWCSGSPTYKAFEANNAAIIGLMTEHGGWVDAGAAGYARQTEIARKMLAGEMESHIEPNDFSGHTVAEQLLWGGASSSTPEIVKMALDQVDWAREDPRWFGMLWRPLCGADDPRAAEAIECFRMILERSGPHHTGDTYRQTMLHEVMSRNAHPEMATMLLDVGARMDARDVLLNSTPLGWGCRWGSTELVKLLLARGADSVENDAEAWAKPRAWAETMYRTEILALLSPKS
jgi:ankyrin repeat protein